jgi:hypothetical protein
MRLGAVLTVLFALVMTIFSPFTAPAQAVPTDMDIDTTALDFGDVTVGTTSPSMAVTLTNTGGDPFGPINIFGGAPPTPEFSASQNCQGVTLPAGGSCQVTYTFSPGSCEMFTDTSNFTISETANQAEGEDFSVQLQGTGVGCTEPTTTTLTASPNPANEGETVTLTAIVTPVDGALDPDAPTGNVTFVDETETQTLATVPLGSPAVLAINSLSVGTHLISATYLGDATFDGSSGTTTVQILQVAETGTITIVKDANGLDANFGFSVTAPGGAFPCEGAFNLNDGSPLTDDETLTGCEVGVTYTVTETNIPGGWAFVDIQCSDNGDVSYSESGNSIEITLNQDGVDVVCTFFNDPSEGTIVIEKDVNPEPDSTDFSFSDTIPNCNIGTLSDDGAGGLPNTVTCTDVPAGAYTVTEANPSPYVLVSIVCNDPNGGTSVANRTATISLDAGETVTCVFTNRPPTDRGSITIFKDTNPATDDLFFDFDSPFGDFDLEDGQSITFTDLNAGTYVITENPASGWRLDDILCSGGDVSFGSNSVLIHLDATEHVTCTFINERVTSVLPTPTRTPVIVVPPVVTAAPTQIVGGGITAPSAGDGGLLGGSGGPAWALGVVSVVAASGAGWLFLQRMVRRTRG